MKLKLIVTFLAVQFIFAGLAWVSGFDFDRRGYDVGQVVAASILTGIMAIIPIIGWEKTK